MSVRKERAARTEVALKEAARQLFVERGYLNTKITDITAAAGRSAGSFYEHFSSKENLLQALLADMHGQAGEAIAGEAVVGGGTVGGAAGDAGHPREHDLTDRAQLRAHLAVAWRVMRANLPVVVALYESAINRGVRSDALWEQLVQDTAVLCEHLEYLRERGHRLPGEPVLVAAAMGALLSTLAYALLPSNEAGFSDDDVIDTLTELLLAGVRGDPSESGDPSGPGEPSEPGEPLQPR
ncbi:TetR/AcrR family transcriptional regulator [Parafrankia discariae]|uniref:TetR/AcrR family transcriptional regulator n=1 Tax=Parafrankia discariae TaxID=365528 RepID=UPI000376E1EE|nr:TetR/AcrR family transcriptional regulator [Parafrankia discariae]